VSVPEEVVTVVGDDRRRLGEEMKARRRVEMSLQAERMKRVTAEAAMMDIAKLFKLE